ncbi:MAG: peroxiredoxin-like family protein [Pseudomonadota bacterium]
MTALLPDNPVPALSLPLVGGGTFDLTESDAENFTLLVFYRGLHCPICKMQLNDLQDHLGKLQERGVRTVAVSMDSEERAEQSKDDWGLGKLDMAYGMDEATARSFGLYISTAISDTEPDTFSEPGLMLVRPDGNLYMASVQSIPFTRPPLDQLLTGIDYALNKDYPARGTKPA